MKGQRQFWRAAMAGLMLAAASPATGAQPVTETEVEAEVENGPLRGTLMPPEQGGGPVAVIIPGSGPTGRDGDNHNGIKAKYLRQLAQGLAEEGIASIRIDKRGMFGSTGSFPGANDVTFDDYAADARAWLEVAREKAGTDCAWLVGHSEGGLVALLAAQEAGQSLCGLVLVAAPGRGMGEILREQLRSNPANAPVLPDALSAIDALERGKKVDVSGFHPALQQMFWPGVQDFLIDAFGRDPAKLIAGLDLPVLIVQGDNDLQVGLRDAERLSQAQPAAENLVMPGMNHVLRVVPAGDIAANFASYSDSGQPLAPGLAQAIARFIAR